MKKILLLALVLGIGTAKAQTLLKKMDTASFFKKTPVSSSLFKLQKIAPRPYEQPVAAVSFLQQSSNNTGFDVSSFVENFRKKLVQLDQYQLPSYTYAGYEIFFKH